MATKPPETEASTLEKMEMESLKKTHSKKKSVRFSYFDEESLNKSDPSGLEVLEKGVIQNIQDLQRGQKLVRLAFDEDPIDFGKYVSLYKPKPSIPDFMIKRIATRDDLVASISFARADHIASFGRPQEDRFSVGFKIEPKKSVCKDLTPVQKEDLAKRIEKATATLLTCGSTDGVDHDDRQSLTEYLFQQGRNGVLFGRFATEITKVGGSDGKEQFHSFRATDVGTIFFAAPQSTALEQVRNRALQLLKDLKKDKTIAKLEPKKFVDDEYSYVQVINGYPREVFTHEELYVTDVYPVTDIEQGGYPITPIDCAIDAILTHMNITSHNKLYFQSGRAARGMIVIKSADINLDIIAQIRQHFNASINSVSNSWRVPVFGIDPDEEISWEPLDIQGGRDMEFQYLADSNARVILSAFKMSPDELPGYGHLSKATGNQGLSESDNEYKLEAARDVGIRPLVTKFQDFFNEKIIPLIDPIVAQFCDFKFKGLDDDSPEKENNRIQVEMSTHCSYDEVRQRVEKDPMGKDWGGDLPLNPAVQSNLDKYFTVGEILEHFMGRKGAGKDPNLQYRRDPFYFNNLQLQLQIQQMNQQQQQMEQQQQQEQAQQAQQQEQGGEKEGGGGEFQNEITSGADQALQLLGKSEDKLPPNKRRLLAQHRATVKNVMDAWDKESEEALQEVLKVAKKHKKKE